MRPDPGRPARRARDRRLRLVAVLVVAAILGMVWGPAARDPLITLAGALLGLGALAADTVLGRWREPVARSAPQTPAAVENSKAPDPHFPIYPEVN